MHLIALQEEAQHEEVVLCGIGLQRNQQNILSIRFPPVSKQNLVAYNSIDYIG